MLSTLVLATLTQLAARLSVVDVSAPDAIYEDVSRGLADFVAVQLEKKGFTAKRADEGELTVEGCRVGPCLAVIAKTQGADVLVLLDATEDDKGRITVALTALRGTDGLPLAVGVWKTTDAPQVTKPLTAFITSLEKAWVRAKAKPADRAR